MTPAAHSHSHSHSQVWLIGGPGAELRPSGATSRRRALQSTNDGVVLRLGAGGPEVRLVGLTVLGRIVTTGGSTNNARLTAENCSLDGRLELDLFATATGEGLTVHGGEVILRRSEVRDWRAGGVKVSSGTLRVSDSRLHLNGRLAPATFGAVRVLGDSSEVYMTRTLLDENGYASDGCGASGRACVRGGALRVDGGNKIELSDGTLMERNYAFEGSSIYVDTALGSTSTVEYLLPTPLGHYVIITNRGSKAPLSMALVDDSYPPQCAGGRFGSSDERSEQSSPRCSGACPAGHACAPGTVQPVQCGRGLYCPPGSLVPSNCPAGSYGAAPGLGSAADCTPCPAGHRCAEGSVEEEPCPRGTSAPTVGSPDCADCAPGKYSDTRGQSACLTCPEGRWCAEGASEANMLLAGTYSPARGLSAPTQAIDCPQGSFCVAGSSAPAACVPGTFGNKPGLTDPLDCLVTRPAARDRTQQPNLPEPPTPECHRPAPPVCVYVWPSADVLDAQVQ